MDNATATTLQQIGTDVIQSFTAIVFETFLIAIYTVLVIKTSRRLYRKASQSRVSLITLIVILLMFSMALTMWSFDIINFIRQVQIPLVRNPEAPLVEKYQESQQSLFRLLAPLDLLYAYEALLGDGIVVWRVYVLWGNSKRKWITAIPCALLVGSFVAAILLTFCVVRLGTKIIDGSFQTPAFCKNVQTASYSMPTATTAVATVLIGWKSWEYRKSSKALHNVATSVSGGATTRRVQRILTVLIESGLVYFIFFLIIVIFNTPGIENNSGLSFAFFVYSYCTSVVVGLYPTIVILLAASERTEIDITASAPIHFSTSKFSTNGVNSRRATRIGDDLELSTFNLTSSINPSGSEYKPAAL